MPFSFTFNGGFFDLSSFLSRLEPFVTLSNDKIAVRGRLMRLESLAPEPAPAGFPQMQAQIGAATYIVPPTQDIAGGDAAGARRPGTAPATPDDGSTPSTTTATATGAAQ